MSVAYFAAGCFWGVQRFFSELEGVQDTIVGYAGGDSEDPTYEDVCKGTTGHAEAIQVEFDPAVISYETLVHAFFECHNPTTLNQQGPDIGSQYRSAIFYLDDEQAATARDVMLELDDADMFPSKIVTEITEFTNFYRAEEYHQDYFKKQGH